MRLVMGTVCVLWQAAAFSNNESDISSKMECGWLQSEDLYVIIIFLIS